MKTLLRPTLLLLAAGLAACSNSGDEAEAGPENTAEVVQEVPAPAEEPTPVETSPPPAETTAETNVAAPADEDEPSPDEQMLDDASATGMTSRSSRGEERTETEAAQNETE